MNMQLEAGQILTDGLENFEAITDTDLRAYLHCVRGALDVHLAKEVVRHGLWKKYPAADQLKMIKIKTERALHALEFDSFSDVVVSEVPDIINYAIFAQRIVQGRI